MALDCHTTPCGVSRAGTLPVGLILRKSLSFDSFAAFSFEIVLTLTATPAYWAVTSALMARKSPAAV